MHVVRLALGLAISLLGGCGLPQEVPCFSIQARLVEASTDDWNLRLIQSSERPKSAGGALVVVAVVDTGVDENHPLLRGKLLPLLDRVGEDRYSFGGKSFDYTGTDGNGHGTHVAGIVGSIVSKSGVMILPVKSIPNSGVGDDRAIASGLRSAVDWRDPNVPERRVRVINLSVGGKTRSRDLQEAIDYALSHDVLLVVSAGNDGVGVSYPASAPGVVAVAATNRRDQLSSYSNHGPELSLAAPGGDNDDPVESTWPTYLTASDLRKGTSEVHQSQGMIGTSMAAPHVTGVAALLFADAPHLSARQVKVRLESWTTDLGPIGPDPYFGTGRLNEALSLAKVGHDASE